MEGKEKYEILGLIVETEVSKIYYVKKQGDQNPLGHEIGEEGEVHTAGAATQEDSQLGLVPR